MATSQTQYMILLLKLFTFIPITLTVYLTMSLYLQLPPVYKEISDWLMAVMNKKVVWRSVIMEHGGLSVMMALVLRMLM